MIVENKENIHCATEKPRLVKICGHRCVDICWTHAYMHIVHALKTWSGLCAVRQQQFRHVGRPHQQQRAAGVKAQLAKCKHEDMPRAPCSNALCSQSALSTQHHCTEQQTAVCLPAEAPTGEQQQPPPREKITPFRQFK